MAPTDPTRAPEHLVLWDVDHTLIQTGGVGREAFADAFAAVTGMPMVEMAEVTGRTEPVIARETLELHGVAATPTVLDAFYGALADAYDARIDELRARGRALPGAREALRRCALSAVTVSGVVTGNVERVAVVKLVAFGLDELVDFAAGAYGSDDGDRARLVALAQERARAVYGVSFAGKATTVVGDTAFDVDAGLAAGARVVAVASGKHDPAALAAAGADIVLPDLTDHDAVAAALIRM